MAIDYRIAVDWDADGYYHHHLDGDDASEPLNVLASSGTPADVSTWDRAVTGTGGSVAAVTNNVNQSNYDYGLKYLNWTVGTDAGASLFVGYDGVTPPPEFILSTSTQYTAVVWIFNPSASYDSVPLRLRIRAYNGTFTSTIATGSNFNIINGSGWTRQTLTFTSDPTYTQHAIVVERVTGTVAAQFYVSGVMIVAGATAATKFNAGDSSNFYDSLWPRTMDARWRVGFNDILLNQVVAPMNEVTLKLENSDKVFTPEYASSPLNDSYWGQKLVVEASRNSGSTWFRMFTGFTHDVVPSLGSTYGEKVATLTATCTRQYLDGTVVRIPLQESKTTEQILNTLLAETTLPDASTPTVTMTGGSGSTYDYAGDNWPDGIDLLRAITDVCGSDGYRFMFDRNNAAQVVYLGNFAAPGPPSPPPASADYDVAEKWLADSMQYNYAGDVIKNIEMAVYPRKLRPTSAPYTRQLWELTYDVDIPDGDNVDITARYTNEQEDRTIGGRNVTSTSLTATPSTTGLTVGITEKAQSAIVNIANSSGAARTVTGLVLQGQKVIAFDAVYVRSDNAATGSGNGHEIKLDYKLTADVDRADTILSAYLALYQFRQGRVKRFSIDAHKDSTVEEMVVEAGYRTTVDIDNSQVEHAAVYYIIGEEHKLSNINNQSFKHVATYTTERRVIYS